jgi:TPR repeat protein
MGINFLFGLNGTEKDPTKAFYWLSRTPSDDPVGRYWLAVCHDNGVGTVQDPAKAFALFRQSAESGYPPALCDLGVCYENGQGTEPDLSKALALYREAARRGYPMGQCNLGVLYYHGIGVPRNFGKAALLFARAAEQRLPRAQSLLGVCYEFGNGVPRDERKAFLLYQEAARQNYPDGLCSLGVLYYQGKGVARDGKMAFSLFQKAAENTGAEDQQAQAQNDIGQGHSQLEGDLHRAARALRKARQGIGRRHGEQKAEERGYCGGLHTQPQRKTGIGRL